MLRQDAAGEWFNFAEGDGFKSARAFKAKAEAADPAEKVQDAQCHTPPPVAPTPWTTPRRGRDRQSITKGVPEAFAFRCEA